MKLTKDELFEILANVSAKEVQNYCDMVDATPIHELAIALLVGRILDGIEKELFK